MPSQSTPPANPRPVASVVIVSYKGANLVGKCLDHVSAQTFEPFETIVVENGSNDGTSEFIRNAYPWVRLVESATNLGFAGGVNLGTEHARADLVVLLNNDARPRRDFLEKLVARAGASREGDLVSAIVMNDGSAGEEFRNGWTINIVARSHRHPLTPPDFLFFASGGAMLFKKTFYQKPFPDVYFIYSEDTYLGWFARMSGFDVLVAMDSIVGHEGSATMKRLPDIAGFHGEKNRLMNSLIFWERGILMRLVPLLMVDYLLHLSNNPGARTKALAWVLSNRKLISSMRTTVQAQRVRGDNDLLRFVSSRIAPRPGRIARLANTFAASYCRAMGIQTLESEETFSEELARLSNGRGIEPDVSTDAPARS